VNNKKDKGGLAPPRTHQKHWQDNTITQRQQSRREKLNQIAQAAGFASWSAFETAALNGKTRLTPACTATGGILPPEEDYQHPEGDPAIWEGSTPAPGA
jgi:hypothetical protein